MDNGMPIIELSVSGMRTQIAHALQEHHEEIQQEVNRQMAALDIAALVRHEVRRTLEPSMRAAVATAVTRAAESYEVSEALRPLVRDLIVARLSEEKS